MVEESGQKYAVKGDKKVPFTGASSLAFSKGDTLFIAGGSSVDYYRISTGEDLGFFYSAGTTIYSLGLSLNGNLMISIVNQIIELNIADASVIREITAPSLTFLRSVTAGEDSYFAVFYEYAVGRIVGKIFEDGSVEYLIDNYNDDYDDAMISYDTIRNHLIWGGDKGVWKLSLDEPNQSPTANAGADQTVDENTEVSLDASASSDPDEDEITYQWTAPDGITLSDATIVNPTFTAPEVSADTEYTFELVVSDGELLSEKDYVVVTVKNVNQAPTANAGTDQTVDENSEVTLDASASSDSDGETLTYQWTSLDGITLSDNAAENPTFTAPSVSANTDYRFELVVSDGDLQSETDEVIISVTDTTTYTGIGNLLANSKIKVFPNPIKYSVNIQSEYQIESISISDISGRALISTNQTQIDVSALKPAVYFLKITTKSGIFTQKVIIEK